MAWGSVVMEVNHCRSGVIDCMSRCRIGEEGDTAGYETGEARSRTMDTEPLDFAGSQVLLVEDNGA